MKKFLFYLFSFIGLEGMFFALTAIALISYDGNVAKHLPLLIGGGLAGTVFCIFACKAEK